MEIFKITAENEGEVFIIRPLPNPKVFDDDNDKNHIFYETP